MSANVSLIQAKMGVDTSGIKDDMERGAKEIKQHSKKISQNGNGAHEDHLLASSHRVARSVNNVTQSFLAGDSAAMVFGAGLEGLERSLHLPLGSLIALGGAAVMVEKIWENTDKLHEFNAAVSETLNPESGGNYSSSASLHQKLAKVNANLGELNDSSFGKSVGTQLGQLGEWVTSGFDSSEAPGLFGHEGGADKKRIAQANDELRRRAELQQHISELEKGNTDAAEKALHGDERGAELAHIKAEYEAQIGEAYADQNGELAKQLERHQKIAEEQANIKADLRDIGTRESAVDAVTGLGEGEHLSNLNAKLGLSHERSARLDQETANDTPEKEAEHAKAKALENQIAEINRQRADSVEHLEKENEITQAVLDGHSKLAKQKQIELQYDERIAEAERNGRKDQAEKEKAAKELALKQLEVAQILESPEQRRHDREQDRREHRASRLADARKRDAAHGNAVGVHGRARLGDAKDRRGQAAPGAPAAAAGAPLTETNSGAILSALNLIAAKYGGFF